MNTHHILLYHSDKYNVYAHVQIVRLVLQLGSFQIAMLINFTDNE